MVNATCTPIARPNQFWAWARCLVCARRNTLSTGTRNATQSSSVVQWFVYYGLSPIYGSLCIGRSMAETNEAKLRSRSPIWVQARGWYAYARVRHWVMNNEPARRLAEIKYYKSSTDQPCELICYSRWNWNSTLVSVSIKLPSYYSRFFFRFWFFR